MPLSKEPNLKEVLSDREEVYGDALENFDKIGKIWGALLGIDPIPAYQVALMMDSLKTVRAFKNPHHNDSWVDKLGYIQHAIEILNR
jgi:Domain of unknown function (DUF6378)